MSDLPREHPKCSFCHSQNVVSVSPKTAAFIGAGGLIGGIVGAVASKDNDNGVSAGPVIAGTLTGAMAGLSAGKEILKGEPGKPYICLDCFHSFTHVPGLQR